MCIAVLTWMIARAWPTNHPSESERGYIEFVHSALHEDGAHACRRPLRNFLEILHPRLDGLKPLLDAMHYYLCRIPWALLESFYRDTGRVFPLHPAHAFVALRKIITCFITNCEPDVLDVPLRTDKPRPAPLGHSRSVEQSHSPVSSPSSGGQKRKAEDCDDPRPPKRQASAENDATGIAEWHIGRDNIRFTTPRGVAILASRHRRWLGLG